jgi:hypothetical protein
MHRLVIWAFAFAVIPLFFAVVREFLLTAKAEPSGTDGLDGPPKSMVRHEPAYSKHI